MNDTDMVVKVAIDDLEASNVRRLTPTECDLLMGFPKDYTATYGDATPDSPRYKADGNSWISNEPEWVMSRIEREERRSGNDAPIKYATTCSGVECHSVSVAGRDWHPLFYSEIEPFPCELLKRKYPLIPNLGDMTKIRVERFDRKDGASQAVVTNGDKMVATARDFGSAVVDVFSGGTPCQDYSIAGKRAGGAEDSGTRSSLAFHFQRIATELNAKWICWENVPGAFSVNGGRDFAWFLYRCMEAGYSLAWRVLDGEYVTTERFPRAIAQRRRRIWLVGRRGPHWQKAASVLFEPLKCVGWTPPERWIGIGFDEAFRDGRPVERIADDGNDGSADDLQGDHISGGCGDSPSPRRVLREADLRINPPKGRFGNVRPVDLEAFARTIGTPLYNGSVFGNGTEPSPEAFAEKFLANIGNAGIMADGVVVTMKVPEWNAGLTEEQLAAMPDEKREAYDGTVCGLSDILFETVDPKYDLSWKACWGILRRAQARGKRLKVELEVVLRWRCIKYRNFVEWAMVNAKNDADRANAKRCFDEVIAPSWTDELKPYLVPLDGKAAETASEEEDVENAEAVMDGDEVAEDEE